MEDACHDTVVFQPGESILSGEVRQLPKSMLVLAPHFAVEGALWAKAQTSTYSASPKGLHGAMSSAISPWFPARRSAQDAYLPGEVAIVSM